MKSFLAVHTGLLKPHIEFALIYDHKRTETLLDVMCNALDKNVTLSFVKCFRERTFTRQTSQRCHNPKVTYRICYGNVWKLC